MLFYSKRLNVPQALLLFPSADRGDICGNEIIACAKTKPSAVK